MTKSLFLDTSNKQWFNTIARNSAYEKTHQNRTTTIYGGCCPSLSKLINKVLDFVLSYFSTSYRTLKDFYANYYQQKLNAGRVQVAEQPAKPEPKAASPRGTETKPVVTVISPKAPSEPSSASAPSPKHPIQSPLPSRPIETMVIDVTQKTEQDRSPAAAEDSPLAMAPSSDEGFQTPRGSPTEIDEPFDDSSPVGMLVTPHAETTTTDSDPVMEQPLAPPNSPKVMVITDIASEKAKDDVVLETPKKDEPTPSPKVIHTSYEATPPAPPQTKKKWWLASLVIGLLAIPSILQGGTSPTTLPLEPSRNFGRDLQRLCQKIGVQRFDNNALECRGDLIGGELHCHLTVEQNARNEWLTQAESPWIYQNGRVEYNRTATPDSEQNTKPIVKSGNFHVAHFSRNEFPSDYEYLSKFVNFYGRFPPADEAFGGQENYVPFKTIIKGGTRG